MITAVMATVNVAPVALQRQGFATVTEAVPAVAIRDAGTVAVSCVEETNVVTSAVPFQFTVEPETKLVPLTVNVNCTPPGAVQLGLSELIALIVMTSVAVAVLQVPAPLLTVMVTLVVPAAVGVPEITLLLNDKPGGSGAAV